MMFFENDANDETSGTITAAGFTTTGSLTMNHSTSGTVAITTIDSSTSFTDDNSTLMTSNAIKNKIEGYEYLDTITLTAGTGINFSNTSTTNNTFASTISCDLEGVELSNTDISGTNKFLRADGDGTCSWVVPPDTIYIFLLQVIIYWRC